jgi:pSer/pThr/pTyr-binding forkhead associated (FHA) protein
LRIQRSEAGKERENVEGEAELLVADGTIQALASEFSVGRAPENDFVLGKAGISRLHARLIEQDGHWFVEDRGSLHGTHLNSVRLQPGVLYRLRHADRIAVGSDTFVFLARRELADPDETARFEASRLAATRPLSPFQRLVVTTLCEPWLAGGSLDELPSNEEIADRLGTPAATESVKAALRRAYAKADLGSQSSAGKRRRLCLVALQRGWLLK